MAGRASDREAFLALANGLRELVGAHLGLELIEDRDDHIAVRFLRVLPEDWDVHAVPGHYELSFDSFLLEYEPLNDLKDATRALAICDALIAGRGVHLEAKDGLASKVWIFLDSRGLRSAVTSGRSTCTLRRPKPASQREWLRRRYIPLTERSVTQ
jgi:hypothetical protein